MQKLVNLALILLVFLSSCGFRDSESYLRGRVVKLMGNGSVCSGEQIKAPSGVNYILSAAHCLGLATNGQMPVITEAGDHIQRRVIAEDPKSDLLLIEGLPGVEGVPIAESSYPGEHVRTLTHGANLDTYMTEGSLIEDQDIYIMAFLINGPEDAARCASMSKYTELSDGFNRGCLMHVTETITNAMIVPGSSGGMVVDHNGDLVGVVSAGNGSFGALVILSDIQTFLAAY